MDAHRWHRLQALFLEVRSAPDADRERLLAERCGDDDELRSDLRSPYGAHWARRRASSRASSSSRVSS